MDGRNDQSAFDDLVVTKRQYNLPTNGVNASSSSTSNRSSFANGDIVTIIRDTVFGRKKRIVSEFTHINEGILDEMTVEGFLDYITRERLSSMPHRGSLWDRVLRWAEFYALQVASYADTISPFVPESRTATKQIFVLLQSLLEHGEENAGALNITFGVFYKLGLSLAFLNSCETKLALNSHVREDVAKAFDDVYTLVLDVASYYQKAVRGLSTGSVTLDFIGLFRDNLDNFYKCKNSIINHMWRHSVGSNASEDVARARKWLNQRSSYLNAISTDSHIYQSQYDEYTCEWFQRHLLSFTRGSEEVLTILAPAGCGKTILSNWIQERLQRPLDHKTYSTLKFTFDADVPHEITSLAMVKSLTLQLMDIRVGNADMLGAILEAYTHDDEPAIIEDRLWEAIDAGFTKSSDPTMIIIDGLDQIKGGITASICDRLTKLSVKHTSLKSIILSRPHPTLPTANKKWKVFEIKPDDVYEDVKHIARHALQYCEQFLVQKESDRQATVEHLVKKSNGSFLLLLLTVELLKSSKSIDDFNKNVQEASTTLEGAIQKQAGRIDFADNDMKLIFSLLLVAERPLNQAEVESLLQVDVHKRAITNRHIHFQDKLAKSHGLLKSSQTQVIRFRHSAVRSYFSNLQTEGKRLIGTKDAQTDFTLRLLIYSKACLTKKYSITLESLPSLEADKTYREYRLLEYAVRNWIAHFRNSSLYKATGPFNFSPEIKSSFPSSNHMILLEWKSWDEQASKKQVIDMHNTALSVRSEVFDQKHEFILQQLIVCGFVYHEYSSPDLAATYFYRASRVSQDILDKFNRITIKCTLQFLTITDAMVFTRRTEVVTYREEMLRYIITAYKHEHGESSEIVIRYMKTLAELYTAVHEEDHAAAIWKEIRLVIVKKHGAGSNQDREIMGKLVVVLKGKMDEEIEKYYGDIFTIGEEVEVVWDEARIKMFLDLAIACEQRKEWSEAEEIYVTMWSRLLHLCKHDHADNIVFRIRVLRVAVEYVNFLRRRNRNEEAKNILIIVWTEHEHFGCESMDFYLQLKVIGEMMRTLTLLSMSLSIFEKISSWFKAVGKYDHEVVKICEGYVYEVIQEITTTETYRKEETSEYVETVVRRVVNSTTVVTKEYISVTRSAVQSYIKKEQWSEAISVLTKSLTILWTESSWGGEIVLPENHMDEAIEFAIELGRCHMQSKHYHESLSCYLQLWQAVRSSCAFQDKRRKLVADILISFYREQRRWKLLIALHREILIEYRRHLGNTHRDTIDLLYLIGSLILEHGHGQAEDYFREIVDVIGQSDTKKSFKAYQLLCQIYYDESRWLELKDVCDVLWKLFVHHHKEFEFDETFVDLLYVRYMYVLRYHHKSDHKLLAAVALQFKDSCIAKFGSSSAISVRSRMEYASILVEEKSTISEAISVYEEIITISKSSKTSVSEASMTTISKHLTEAYVYAHAHGTMSASTTQRAIQVLQERFEYLRRSLGYAHKDTLTVLTELIQMRLKLKAADFEYTTTQQLQDIVLEIITKEKQSQVLFEAAGKIGSIYKSCGLNQFGLRLVNEIRRKVVSGHEFGSKDGIKIDKSVGRVSMVFLVELEISLEGSGHNHSDVMADWLTEAVLYENYSRCFKTKTKIEIFLTRSAQLRAFWEKHGRMEDIRRLVNSVFEVFFQQFGTITKREFKPDTVRLLMVSILIRLGSREPRDVELSTLAFSAGNSKVLELSKSCKFVEAHELGCYTFHFILNQGGYHKAGLIGYGFELATLMAGRDTPGIPTDVRLKMLQTSREVMNEVIHACKDMNINFSQLQDHELNNLVTLLGEQENYKELELILESLWKSRQGQKKHWSEDTLINLGKSLIESRYLANSGKDHSHSAIHLAEDISYNLRRVLGGLHPHTLEISTLLSQLYTDAEQYGNAINVHEEILQLIVSGDDGDDRTIDYVTAETARKHFNLLKAAYLRNGRWVKTNRTYETLIESLLSMKQYRHDPAFKDAQPVHMWKRDEQVPEHLGTFEKPARWDFIVKDDIKGSEPGKGTRSNGMVNGVKTPTIEKHERPKGWSLRRISENWGLSFHGGDKLNAKIVY